MNDQTAIMPYAAGGLAGSTYRPLQWPVAVDQWLKSLDSANTRRNYAATLTGFFSAAGIDAVCEVTPEMLAAWRGAMVARAELPGADKRRISPATVNRHLSAARAFFDYWRALSTPQAMHVLFSGDAQRHALKALKAHIEKPFAILSGDAEIAALLDAATQCGDIDQGRERLARQISQPVTDASAERDQLIVTVALATGLRCAELAALNIGSLVAESWYNEREQRQREAWFMYVKAGKGNKDRHVEISTEDAAVILAYVQSTGRHYGRPDENQAPLFLSTGNRNRGGRMTYGKRKTPTLSVCSNVLGRGFRLLVSFPFCWMFVFYVADTDTNKSLKNPVSYLRKYLAGQSKEKPVP